jgi:predicted DNA-binding transcriptional regulator AlpA
MSDKKPDSFESLIDTEKLVELTGMGKTFIDSARVNLGLPHYKLGRSVRYRLSEVNRWLKERHQAG